MGKSFLLLIVFLLFFSCQKDQNVYSSIEANKGKVSENNYKKASLNELYYELLYQVSFDTSNALTHKELQYYERSALLEKDSLHIYRANNLYIALNPAIHLDDKRFSQVFRSIKYFENKNLEYDTYYSNFIAAEYYLALQYYKTGENFIFKALKSLGIKAEEYAYEKSLASMTAANILFKQKRYDESYSMIQTYKKYSKNIDYKLFSTERINLLKSLYYNNTAVIGNIGNKINHVQSIRYLQKANSLVKGDESTAMQKGTATFNIFSYKVKNRDTDSIEFYFKEFIKFAKPFENTPQVQLNSAIIPLYYLYIKKDTLTAKNYQKQLLSQNECSYHNIHLQKKIYEQYITDLDSSSLQLYKDYIAVLDKIKNENKTKFGTNQKIVFKNYSLVNENAQLKKGIFYIVGIILILSITIFFIILNVIQKIDYKKIRLKNNYLEQDAKAFEITLKYKNDVENRLLMNKRQIFMELHDNIVNKLFSARFMLHQDYRKENTIETTRQTLLDIKSTLLQICENYNELNDLFEKNSFEAALTELIENQPHNKVTFSHFVAPDIEWVHINPKIRFHLYRIIQELIQNIHKHSSATAASVTISLEGTFLKLSVKDNGKGLRKSQKKGIGLSNITERLYEIDGSLDTNTSDGTEFIIKIRL